MPGLPTANMLLRLITVLLALCQPLAVNSQKDGIVRIGVLMLQGSWSTLSSWNATFNTFLNAQLGASTGLYFNASVVSYANSFSAIKNQDLDFWFGDPLAFSCLELESALDPVATVIMSRGGKTTPSLSGSAFVSGNSTISSVLDLKGKVIASASFFNPNVLSPFLSFQNQGLNFYADPAQLIYGLGNVPIVNMVLSGQADVGIMSGGTLENMVYLHQLNRSSFRFLAPETAVDSYDPAYPFTHNGPLMPGWILSALPHVNASLTTKVQAALTTLNSGSPAARAGGFSSFTPPRSYAIMFRIARALNWFKDTMSNEQLTQCSVRSDAGFAPITCPEGWYKIPDIDIANSCNQPGALPCPSGLSCVCNPCREIAKEPFTLRLVQIDSQPIGSISNTTIQCAKMEICIQIQQLQSLTFQVVDNLYAARGTLGLANISRVSWRGNVGEDWEFIPANESVSPGVSSFTFKPLQLGAHVVSVAVDGEEIPGSPTLLQVGLRVCKDAHALPSVLGQCECISGYSANRDGSCTHNSYRTLILAIAVPVGTALLVAFATFIVLQIKHQKEEMAWQIPRAAIVFDDPPIVLGSGTFGVVFKGKYRGTPVAVKELHKMKSDATTPRATGSYTFKTFLKNKNMQAKERDQPIRTSIQLSRLMDKAVRKERKSLDFNNPVAISAHTNLAAGEETPTVPCTNPRRASNLMESALDSPKTQKRSSQSTSAVVTFSEMSIDNLEGGSTGRRQASRRNLLSSFTGRGRFFGNASTNTQADFKKEMHLMASLKNPNIVSTLGVVLGLDDGQPPWLILELMERGNLHELLTNNTIDLDLSLAMTIVKDIVDGMVFLHTANPPILHGDIKSRNILVGDSFHAKLSDFGMSGIKLKQGCIGGTPFFMAPELLRGEPQSPASDVYAFGILLSEIVNRAEPFAGENPQEVLLQVANISAKVDKRPTIPEDAPPLLAEIMQECWNKNPLRRPTFLEISERLGKIDSRSEIADALRAKVEEGKKDLRLLEKVFPSKVAKALREGRAVEPETYESVTILFSDIVGFTDISRTLPPECVMEMLNRLYQKFDAITTKHGLFKVETIGDAYMVVANLSEPQPNDHTKRIAAFAVEQIQAANSVPVKLDDPSLGFINIRVGFHVGPVVASVVGSINPRYCLFGDTVNTSSRMESNSVKNCIHMSEAAAELLALQNPEVTLSKRKEKLHVKGKGEMQTFWLLADGVGVPDC